MRIKRDFIYDPSLVLYLPLYELDGASFMSKDAYGHLCTVTGALWRPNGRYFDGSDDKLDCPDAGFPSGATSRTIIIWAKNHEPSGATGGGYLFQYGTSASPYGRGFGIGIPTDTADLNFFGYGDDFDTGINLDDDEFHHITVTYDGSDVRAFKDLIEGSNSPTAKTLNTVLDGECTIGYSGGEYINMTIGEVIVYSRLLTPLEIQHIYLATKWRYR